MLRHWRTARRLSQLDVALEAEVSSRHVSFLESGRSTPSRTMVRRLAEVLEVPLQDRNLLLQAAGFAPVYTQTGLDAPGMAGVREALVLILRHHEPFSAWAVTRRWDVVMANGPSAASLSALTGAPVPAREVLPPPRPNVLTLLFESDALRQQIVNWETVARAVVARTRREAWWHRDDALAARVRELSARLPPETGAAAGADDTVVVPIEVRQDGRRLRFFNTITTLGTPLDVTLQELRIEAFHPADEETARLVRAAAE